MTSNPGVPPSRTRPIVLLTKIKSKPRLGAMTLAFFRRGEDLEATEFENVPHDDPALVPPKLGFRNFDRIPRRRAPLLLVFLVVLSAGFSVYARHHGPELRGDAARIATAVGAKLSEAWVYLKQLVAGHARAQ
ncbi:MAG: hypothetical protein ACJ8F1_23015 [Polyangia bacterium]